MANNGKKKGLGLGIDAFFKTSENELSEAQTNADNEKESKVGAVMEVNIFDVEPGEGQPRKAFDEEKINQLAASIKEHGVIQPLIVVKKDKVYQIVAGERRWRAARIAGLKTIPVIEKSMTKREVLEVALIENLQREDLNPIEEAEAYQRLINEYSLTQENLSEILSKSRSAIANTLRLLTLNDNVRKMVISGELSEGHARALLGLKKSTDIEKVAAKAVERGLNVRQTENLVKLTNNPPQGTDKKSENDVDLYSLAIKDTEKKLKERFGTKVTFTDKEGKGKIQIEFFTSDEREKILSMLLNN